MKKWEYKTVTLDKKSFADEEILNKFGSEGWEMIDFEGYQNQGYIVIFKREKK